MPISEKLIHTPFGEIPEDDVQALSFKLAWYLRYGNPPTSVQRETAQARVDYGFQYERYVGHLFETHGYRVTYTGIRKGLEDGGVDLVARAPRKVRLIQCKRWRQSIGIDVVSRLHGAVGRFTWEERQGKSEICRTDIRGVLITSGAITADAKGLAAHLGILLMENLQYQPYPAIKGKLILNKELEAIASSTRPEVVASSTRPEIVASSPRPEIVASSTRPEIVASSPRPVAGKILMPFDKAYDKTTMDLTHGDRFFSSPREAFQEGFYYPPFHGEILRRIHELKKQ